MQQSRQFPLKQCKYYPCQKKSFSRDIHEIDPRCNHVMSCDINFDLQCELAMRRYRGSRRCRTEAQFCKISHDQAVDQPHDFLGCNDFVLARVVGAIDELVTLCID